MKLLGLAFACLLFPSIAYAGGNGTIERPGVTKILATSGNVAAATASATLSATSGRLTYITGFSITGTGATAGQAVVVTVTGLLGGTITFTIASATGVAVGNPLFNYEFPTPWPASAQNTAILVSCATLGAGSTNNVVTAFGFVE